MGGDRDHLVSRESLVSRDATYSERSADFRPSRNRRIATGGLLALRFASRLTKEVALLRASGLCRTFDTRVANVLAASNV
jgi:hypothetical protein